MREVFHRELDAVNGALAAMARLVAAAMSLASWSLVDADLVLADGVITGDAAVDRLRDDLDARTVNLLAAALDPLAIAGVASGVLIMYATGLFVPA